MKIASNKEEKQLAYKVEYKRFKKALKEEFYLEAVSIGYAIIEDRLIAFLHHAGFVSRNHERLKINKMVYPYVRQLMDVSETSAIIVRSISKKVELIRRLIEMSEGEAEAIDQYVQQYLNDCKRKKSVAKPGYMLFLHRYVSNVDREEVLTLLNQIDNWRNTRNRLVHALLNQKVEYADAMKKNCAEESYSISRKLDDYLVKPFKKKSRIRGKYNIQ